MIWQSYVDEESGLEPSSLQLLRPAAEGYGYLNTQHWAQSPKLESWLNGHKIWLATSYRASYSSASSTLINLFPAHA